MHLCSEQWWRIQDKNTPQTSVTRLWPFDHWSSSWASPYEAFVCLVVYSVSKSECLSQWWHVLAWECPRDEVFMLMESEGVWGWLGEIPVSALNPSTSKRLFTENTGWWRDNLRKIHVSLHSFSRSFPSLSRWPFSLFRFQSCDGYVPRLYRSVQWSA